MLHMHVDIESGQAKILANNKEANMKRVIPLERIMFRIGLIILLSKLYVCLCWPAIDLWQGFQSFFSSVVIFHVRTATSSWKHFRENPPAASTGDIRSPHTIDIMHPRIISVKLSLKSQPWSYIACGDFFARDTYPHSKGLKEYNLSKADDD